MQFGRCFQQTKFFALDSSTLTFIKSILDSNRSNKKQILYRQMSKRFAIIFGIILLTEILIGQFFPHLSFVNGTLTITNKIIGYFSFSVFLFCVPLLFKAKKWVTIPWGLLLFTFLFINSCGEIYPIDTTTEPMDIATLQSDKDGNKLIVREYTNAKTDVQIRDTVLVKDIFIFRQFIERKQ
jgi:hypothetical protein